MGHTYRRDSSKEKMVRDGNTQWKGEENKLAKIRHPRDFRHMMNRNTEDIDAVTQQER